MTTPQARVLRIPSIERQLQASPAGSDSEWKSKLLDFAKLATAAGGLVPFPFVTTATGVISILLDMLEAVNKNKDDLRTLVLSIIDTVVVIRNDIIVREELSDPGYVTMCMEFNDYLLGILNDLNERKREDRAFAMHYITSNSTRAMLDSYKRRLEEMRANFMLVTLVGTRFAIADLRKDLDAMRLALSAMPVPSHDLLIANCNRANDVSALPAREISPNLANDIDTRCLIIKLHKAIVALRSEIPHTADQSGELVSPYLDLPTNVDMQFAIEEIYKQVVIMRSDISESSRGIPSQDSIKPDRGLVDDVGTQSITGTETLPFPQGQFADEADRQSVAESFYTCLEGPAIDVDTLTFVTEMYEDVIALQPTTPFYSNFENITDCDSETSIPRAHRFRVSSWFGRRRKVRYVDGRTGMEVDKYGRPVYRI